MQYLLRVIPKLVICLRDHQERTDFIPKFVKYLKKDQIRYPHLVLAAVFCVNYANTMHRRTTARYGRSLKAAAYAAFHVAVDISAMLFCSFYLEGFQNLILSGILDVIDGFTNED